LYGCENYFLREGNRVLRGRFASKRKWREAREDCIRFTKYYQGNHLREDEMGGTCSSHGK
jgi:hypothetical protein